AGSRSAARPRRAGRRGSAHRSPRHSIRPTLRQPERSLSSGYGARMVRMRLEPQDDLLHPAEEAKNFNESRYYNVFDPGPGFGAWLRMGNRPNEGYAEMTVCLYLPDGRVGFMFKRPHIEGHAAHDAGGLRFEVVE